MSILKQLLDAQSPIHQNSPTQYHHNHALQWRCCAKGVFEFIPPNIPQKYLIISVGIHGNETAPIEIVADLCDELMAGDLALRVHLLVIFGNLSAMHQELRYCEEDLNRLFGDNFANADAKLSLEGRRAYQLKQIVQDFIAKSKDTPCYHLDLHTAIRVSLMPVFALFPKQQSDGDNQADDFLLSVLNASQVDAAVYHNQSNGTFSYFSQRLGAKSVTLELGAVAKFGHNNLADFAACDDTLRAIITDSSLPKRPKPPIVHFDVLTTIIKKSDDFVLALPSDTPNFTPIAKGEIIAQEPERIYLAKRDVFTLFLNAKVATGLRAGILLIKRG